MNRVYILALLSGSIGATALAQPYIGTALWRWEGSADGSATWTPGELVVPPEQESVLVRARVFWSSPAVRFVHTGFDVAVTGKEGTTDAAGSFAFNPRFFSTFPHRIATSRFGNVLKIDYDLDTEPPGQGPYSLGIQSNETFGLPPLDHPIEIFRFRLNFDGEPGLRTVHEYFMPSTLYGTGMNTTDRVLVLSTIGGGGAGYILPQTNRESLNIRVLPAPGGLALLAGVAIGVPRRRRGCEGEERQRAIGNGERDSRHLPARARRRVSGCIAAWVASWRECQTASGTNPRTPTPTMRHNRAQRHMSGPPENCRAFAAIGCAAVSAASPALASSARSPAGARSRHQPNRPVT